MEFLVLITIGLATLINAYIIYYFSSKIIKVIKKELRTYSQEVSFYSKIQKQNTEKLISLLDKTFIPTVESSPNEASKEDVDEIEFSEITPFDIPKELKLEMEGGDSTIPPGYTEKN